MPTWSNRPESTPTSRSPTRPLRANPPPRCDRPGTSPREWNASVATTPGAATYWGSTPRVSIEPPPATHRAATNSSVSLAWASSTDPSPVPRPQSWPIPTTPLRRPSGGRGVFCTSTVRTATACTPAAPCWPTCTPTSRWRPPACSMPNPPRARLASETHGSSLRVTRSAACCTSESRNSAAAGCHTSVRKSSTGLQPTWSATGSPTSPAPTHRLPCSRMPRRTRGSWRPRGSLNSKPPETASRLRCWHAHSPPPPRHCCFSSASIGPVRNSPQPHASRSSPRPSHMMTSPRETSSRGSYPKSDVCRDSGE